MQALPFRVDSDPFVSHFSRYLRDHYFMGLAADYKQSAQFTLDIAEQVHGRTTRFHSCLVPWVKSVFDLDAATVIEIGSGTGSSTLAFAPCVKHIHCYEICDRSRNAALARQKFFGIDNVSFEPGLFEPECRFVSAGNKADMVLLIAVLEHMTYDELETVLRTAYATLRPGGIIVVAETPNRLTVSDYHSSWVPFYQWLPPEIRQRYHDRSPRQHFAYELAEVQKHNPGALSNHLTRWGNGISFHDFELALGANVHQWVIADGWEETVRPLATWFKDDDLLVDVFKRFEVPAHRAFARSWLYLILQKPG